MNSIMKFIYQNQTALIAVGALAVAVLFIVLLKRTVKSRQKRKEIQQAAEDRARDENLNNIILNSHCRAGEKKEIYKPYDVDYSNDGQGKNDKNSPFAAPDSHRVMIQLVEKTELSTRKFMLNPEKIIRIGSDLQTNDISVLADGVSSNQCEIFAAAGKVYIRHTGDKNKTIIRRKKEQAFVDEKGIRLLSDDIIILGKVTYDVTITD